MADVEDKVYFSELKKKAQEVNRLRAERKARRKAAKLTAGN